MAKLGQQVRTQELAQQQQRPTRVQRVQAKRSKEQFEALRQEASRIQQEKFKDKVVQVQETYYEYRPKEYSEKAWSRLKQDRRDAILRQYERGRGFEYYADRGELVRIPRTRTVSKTIPFTLDEGENSYENIYSTLSPDIQQFFATPETLKQERSDRIQGNITRADERINQAKLRIEQLNQKYQEDKRKLQEWWQRKPSKYRDDPRNRENYKRDERRLEDDYEEDLAQQRGLIEGYQKGKSELSSQKDIQFGAIESYASDLADYYEGREEARNEKREFERKQIKELEQRNKEAQAKGFDFTGTITQSFVNQKTKQETVQGTKYYLGGAEVSGKEFAKQFDIYVKPSGSKLIVAKGTDLSKLSPSQKEALFPEEFARAREQEAQRLQAYEQQVETLPLGTPSPAPKPEKSIFRKIIDPVGDVLSGVFLKSTVGLGLRGFVSGEPTAFSGEELEEKRQEALDKATIFGFTRGELVRGKEGEERSLSSFFGVGFPGLIDISGTQIEGIKLSRNVRESGELTVAQGQVDIKNIEGGAETLTSYDNEVKDLNEQVKAGKIDATVAQQRYTDIEQKRLAVFEDLASKGIRTNVETNEDGTQTLTFTSKALSTDLAPASVKLLRQTDTLGKTQLIAGGLATEFVEFGTIGLLTGGTGATAKIGLLVTKLPKALQVGGLAVAGTALLANIGFSGYKGIERGEQAGIGKVGGFALGAGIPLTQTLAFAGGSYVGNKIYTEGIISKLEKGGFTKPTQEKIIIDGKEYKVPAQARAGKTQFSEGKEATRVLQGDKLQTKIPGTDIKIETTGKIKGAFVGEKGGSLGESVSKITGKNAGAYKNQKFFSRALYFDERGKTAIVTFTKTPKGVRVDQFITGTKANNFKILEETAQGGKTVFIDFNRYVARVGEPIYVQGGSLSDASVKSIFSRFIGRDQLFTGFADDVAPYTIGRTQQVISISPKVAKSGVFDTSAGAVKIISEKDTVQTFGSIGSSRVARTDALKDIINQITKQEGGFAVFTKGFLANKRGQVVLPFAQPETVTTPTTIQIPSSVFSQDVGVSVTPITSQLESTIRSALATNAFSGTLLLTGTGSGVKLSQRNRQALNQRISQLQLQNLTNLQVQQNIQQQRQTQQQKQTQQQTLQQLLQQQQIQIPSSPGLPTPTPTPNLPAIPGLPDFDLQFFDAVRRKAKKKKQGKELAYVQDFTSKIVGFEPVEVSQKEAIKLAQKVQTGFEIRQPIVLKGSQQSKDQRRLRKLLAQ